jgi:protein-S-isoprenylcysteine O-methyltransferase Ste14
MTPQLARSTEGVAWVAWLTYWLVASFRVKQTRQRSTGPAQPTQRILMLVAAVVYFAPAARLGLLARRFVPETSATLWIGVALTFAGLGIAVWARVILAGNWSSTIVLKAGHELIRTGPYARVRHPIYTGILIAAAGSALVLGRLNALASLLLLTTGFWIKARGEESLLAGEFGAALDSYRTQTGMFLPRWL